MKALTDYPTPETETILKAIVLAHNPETDGEHFRKLMGCAMANVESLERRLAACREALSQIDTLDCKDGPGGCWQAEVAHAALSLTAPLA